MAAEIQNERNTAPAPSHKAKRCTVRLTMKTPDSVMNILVQRALCALSRWDREMLLKQKYQQADRYLLKIEDKPH